MTKKGPIFIFRAKNPIQCLSEALDDAVTLDCPTPGGCHYSRALKNGRVLATSLRDVHGAGPEGSDGLTMDWPSALDLRALSRPLAQCLTPLGTGILDSRG